MGRARYSRGYVILTETNLWQAHWFPYVRNPETGVEKRKHRTKIVGAKAKMGRYKAEEELRKITHPINATNGRADETTLGGFMDKRWKPLHECHWRKESSVATNNQLLGIIRGRFGNTLLKDLDKVELQEWLNELAGKRCASAIRQLRTFLRSICAEAVEQEYIAKDPSRLLKAPTQLKPADKTVLTWDQLWKVFASLSERDRLILSIEVTVGLRPSELFALRRQSFDGSRMKITETVYRGTLRQYGKTADSTTTVDLPVGLAEQITAWLDKQSITDPAAFLFANSEGGFLGKDNYLTRILYPVRKALNLPKLNFQVLRRTFSTLAQHHGTVKDVQRQMRHTTPDMTAGVYMQPIDQSVQNMVSEMYRKLLTPRTETVQ